MGGGPYDQRGQINKVLWYLARAQTFPTHATRTPYLRLLSSFFVRSWDSNFSSTSKACNLENQIRDTVNSAQQAPLTTNSCPVRTLTCLV